MSKTNFSAFLFEKQNDQNNEKKKMEEKQNKNYVFIFLLHILAGYL